MMLICLISGTALLASPVEFITPSPEPPAESTEQERNTSDDPELTLLQGSEEQGSPGKATLLLALLLNLLQQPSHLLAQLLCTLLHALAHGLIQLLANHPCLLDETSQNPGKKLYGSHGLQEEGEQGFSGAVREAVGPGAAGSWGQVGEGLRQLGGSKAGAQPRCCQRCALPKALPPAAGPWVQAENPAAESRVPAPALTQPSLTPHTHSRLAQAALGQRCRPVP